MNEERKFKQINRIAKTIQLNKDGEVIEEKKEEVKEEKVVESKKSFSKEKILNLIILILAFLCVIALIIFLFVPVK